MAGEWIPIDIGIWQKPEIQELVDITGTPEDSVVARMIRLWGWASLHSADGTLRATPERLARLHGGDAAFWTAVETVGWLRFDSGAGTIVVTGWEARFSRAAKARAADRIRKSIERQATSGACPESVRDSSGDSRTDPGPEERRRHLPPPPPPRARAKEAEAIVSAWGKAAERGFVKPYLATDLPAAIWDRLAEASWAGEARLALKKIPSCRFFETPPTLRQFVAPDFVAKVLDGTFDDRKKPKAAVAADAGKESAEAAAARWQAGAAESAKRREEFLAAKARARKETA